MPQLSIGEIPKEAFCNAGIFSWHLKYDSLLKYQKPNIHLKKHTIICMSESTDTFIIAYTRAGIQ